MQTRGKQFAISQITCLEQTLPPPVKHFPIPPADEANKVCGKPFKYQNTTHQFWSLKRYQPISPCVIYRQRGDTTLYRAKGTKVHHSSWAVQLLWERKFTTWQVTQLQVNRVVRLFPGFKNKKVHTSSLYIIKG